MLSFTDEWIQNGFITSKNVVKNDVIKLKNPLGEAFWVIVTDILPNGTITGSVNNNLVYDSDYNFGDIVMFTKQDIREHKDFEIRQNQQKIMPDIVQYIYEKLGRIPSIEELELIFTRFHT